MSEEKNCREIFRFFILFQLPSPPSPQTHMQHALLCFFPMLTRNMHGIFRLAHLGPFGMGAGWAGFFSAPGGGVLGTQ